MRVVVTGGSGFISDHLVGELQKKHKVDTLFEDLADRKKILRILPRFQMIYHFAESLANNDFLYQSAIEHKTKIVSIVLSKHVNQTFPTVSFRLSKIYGANQSANSHDVVSIFIRQALNNEPIHIWGDGKQTIDWIHVQDAISAIILIGENKKCEDKIVEVGSGTKISINDLVQKIIHITKSASPILRFKMRPEEKPHIKLKLNTSFLKRIGFKQEIDLNTGLRKTIESYKTRPEIKSFGHNLISRIQFSLCLSSFK